MNSSLFASPNKSVLLNKSGEEVQITKKRSAMALPITSQLSQILESELDKEE